MKNPDSEPPFRFGGDAKEGPLTPFKGAEPPAPDWFKTALKDAPERGFVTVEGAKIETLAWGKRGAPGLLFMHGNAAHADWYSFIAPFFADRFRVAALSWSGMGGSDWREHYRVETFAAEALTAAEETGLFDGGEKPIFAAHSFGALTLRYLSIAHGARLGGAIVLDSRTDMMGRNRREDEDPRRPGPPDRNRPNKVYPTFEAALARFRLAPPQDCENLFAVDYIARRSLKPTPMEDGAMGWTWKFDPFLFRHFSFDDPEGLAAAPACPMAMMWGARSLLMDHERLAQIRALPHAGPMIEIPDAGHHVMLDQPLALVTGLRTLLEAWPGKG